MMTDFFAQIEIRLFVTPPPPLPRTHTAYWCELPCLFVLLYSSRTFSFSPATLMSTPSSRYRDHYGQASSAYLLIPSQQTRRTDPVLVQYWASVADAGPTLNQHRFNTPRLSGCKKETLSKRWYNMGQRQAEFNNALLQYQPETLVSEWITAVQI